MLPSLFPELSAAEQPSLRRMFKDHLDMQIEDLRVMLRLPRKELPAGCNFAAAAMILNLITGASVCFYNASEKTLKDFPPAGKHFKGILRDYFPWAGSPVSATDGADVLWRYSRNPLAHALGLAQENAPEILVSKNRIGPRRILALEDSSTRPVWAAPAVKKIGSDYELNVLGLYWGTHRMLHAVLADSQQLAGAEELAGSIGF